MLSRCARLAAAPAGAAASFSILAAFEKTSHRISQNMGCKTVKGASTGFIQRNFSSAAKPAAKTPAPQMTAKAPSTPGISSSQSLMKWYDGHLKTNPVRTKMITGAALWGLGDAVAQLVPTMMKGDKDEKEQEQTVVPTYDFARTGRAVFFGFAIHAPTSHVHFNFLEWMTVRAGLTGLKIPLFKAFMEQFVYWSWISNSLYHGAMGAMQGMTPRQIYDRIEDVLWETQKAQWVFWIPVQLLNFRFVPVRHQLNVVLLTSVVWTALLSAWYPPQEDKEQEQKKTEN